MLTGMQCIPASIWVKSYSIDRSKVPPYCAKLFLVHLNIQQQSRRMLLSCTQVMAWLCLYSRHNHCIAVKTGKVHIVEQAARK